MGTSYSCSICYFRKKAREVPNEKDSLIPALGPAMPESIDSLTLAAEKMITDLAAKEASHGSDRSLYLSALASAADRFLKLVHEPMDSSYELATERDGVKVYTKDALGGYILRAEWTIPFASKVFVDFLGDTELRKTWDKHIDELRVLQSIDPGVNVYYQSYKKMLAISARDLVIASKKFQCDTAYVDVFCSINYPTMPPRPGYTRAHIVVGGYYIEELASESNQEQSRVVSYSEGSFGGSLPKSLVKKISASNYPTFVKQMGEALKSLEQSHSLS